MLTDTSTLVDMVLSLSYLRAHVHTPFGRSSGTNISDCTVR